MSEVTISHRGDFSKTTKFLNKIMKGRYIPAMLEKYGERGVAALASATPVDTGKTASSWSYEIIEDNGNYELVFNNSNINKGVNIAILLQYGHGTRNGGYVVGRDYINPALRDIFDRLAAEAWGEVTSA